MNNANEGITNQKILDESLEISTNSTLSKYIQTIAKTESKGIEAMIPPAKELLFEISDTLTMMIADNKTLIK